VKTQFFAGFGNFHCDVIDDVMMCFRDFVSLFMMQLFGEFGGGRSEVGREMGG